MLNILASFAEFEHSIRAERQADGIAKARERSRTWHTRCIALYERGSMFRIETDQLTAQDDLPPEILRRLQVEELWARRNVLAELMNAERLQVYARRSVNLAAGCPPMDDVGSRNKLTKLAGTVVPMRNRKSFAPVAL